MRIWFESNLGDAMLAEASLDRVTALFLAEYEKVGRPAEMAVFVRHESEGRLHCEVKVYFSPASAVVAKAVEARPCQRPSSDGLGLLAGSAEAWPACFPGGGVQAGCPARHARPESILEWPSN